MNYDVWGASSTPGPNAPLSDGCHNTRQPGANAVGAISSWSKAGMPLSKLVLGLPSYGYVSQSSATKLTERNYFYPRKLFELGSKQGQIRRQKRSKREIKVGSSTFAAPTQICSDNHSGYGCGGLPSGKSHPGPAPSPAGVIKASSNGDLSSYFGTQIEFNQLISSGVLTKNADGTFTGRSGYTRNWDACSSTVSFSISAPLDFA